MQGTHASVIQGAGWGNLRVWTEATREWDQKCANHRDGAGSAWKKQPASTVDRPGYRFSHTRAEWHKSKLTWARFTRPGLQPLGRGGDVREVSLRDADARTLTPPWSKCDATLRFTSTAERQLWAIWPHLQGGQRSPGCTVHADPPPPPPPPRSHLQPVMKLILYSRAFKCETQTFLKEGNLWTVNTKNSSSEKPECGQVC